MHHVVLPRLNMTMENGTIFWVVENGGYVNEGDVLFEVETDKASIEVQATASGKVYRLVQDGEEAKVNQVIGVIADPNEMVNLDEIKQQLEKPQTESVATVDTPIRKEEKTNSVGPKALPRVRRFAEQLNVDLNSLEGTGPNGTITEEDVRRAADSTKLVMKTVKLTGIRRDMARNITRSTSIPQFSQTVEVDATQLVDFYHSKKHSIPFLTYTDIFMKTIGDVLNRLPEMNVRFDEDHEQLIYHQGVHINLAVSTSEGLVVPLVREVPKESLENLHQKIRDIIQRAKEKKLTPFDVELGSLTFSNLGMYGIDSGVPLLNPGQSIIIFAGSIKETLTLQDQHVTMRPVLNMTFVYDHRVFDGVQAARFTQEVRKAIENIRGHSNASSR